jgi:GTP1/Obg family GTP-binding protein
MRPEYENLHSYFQEIKEQYANAETTKQRLDQLKIAREILKQAQEQVAEFQDEIDRMRKP